MIIRGAFLLIGAWALLMAPAQSQMSSGHDDQGSAAENENADRPINRSLADQVEALEHQAAELAAHVQAQGVDPAAMMATSLERRVRMAKGGVGGISPFSLAQAGVTAMTPQTPGVGMMSGMMDMMSQMMGGMSGGLPMGQVSGMPGSPLSLSTLPGFPGMSHLYHIGATNFFLDHPQHIMLSLEQQRGLSALRTQALLRRAEYSRSIQEAEEQLWLLTAANQPDLTLIERKIREVERRREDSRLTFIKAIIYLTY